MKQKKHENKEPTDTTTILATNDYLVNLKTINNIRFTYREIDIIACMIGGRTYKKISLFLLIAPKTVEMHVRNIMLKIGCNSRDNIIDFIEKSDKFTLIKKHYSKLLIKSTFELELKKILPFTKFSNISCLIFYNKKQKEREPFIIELEKHLNIVGFNAFRKVWQREKAEKFLLGRLKIRQVNYIIYVITDDFLAQLKKNEMEITKEAVRLITMIKQQTSNVIFLLLNNEISLLDSNEALANFTCMHLKEHKGYYLLFFELIKKLIPTLNIDQNINNFKACQTTLLKGSNIQIRQKEDNRSRKALMDYVRRVKKTTVVAIIIVLLIIIAGVMNLSIKQHMAMITSSFYLQNNYNAKKINHNISQQVFNLPSRNTKFTGRYMALQQIESQLGGSKFGLITQAVAGFGGVGKTQLATEFAYQAAEKKIYDAIFWVAAETDIVLANSYTEFAKQLQIDVQGLKAKEMQVLIHKQVANEYNNKKVLFILDNVPNHANIQDYLSRLRKHWPPDSQPHILITTRSQYWEETPLILDVFEATEAIEFVKKHLPDEGNVAIEKLVKTLNYFPLALNQAVAYIKEHTNIDDYLKLYKQQKYKFLDKTVVGDVQYRKSLWKTWNIALAKLTNNALSILYISAYLEPDDIPVDFFTNLTIEERMDAIKELRKHSFIILKNHNKTFKIHRLLQDVIRLNFDVSDEYKNNKLLGIKTMNKGPRTKFIWLNKAISLIDNKFNFDYMQCDKWNEWNRNLLHARSIAEHTFLLKGKTFKRGLELYCKVAMFMTYINLSSDAFAMWLKMKDLLEQQQQTIPKLVIAKIYYNLGAVMMNNKHPRQARNYFNKAIPIIKGESCKQILPKTSDFLSALGVKPFYTLEAALNYKNIFLANTFISLGTAERELGNFNKSIVNYSQAIVILKDCINDDMTKYYNMIALEQLSCSYMRSGNLIQAEHILQGLKEEVDCKYKNHVEQAYVYELLAKLQYIIGEPDKAKALLKTTSQIQEMARSKLHLEMADLAFATARIALAKNDIRQAKAKLETAKQIYDLYYHDNFYNYVFLYLNFCRVYEYLGEYNKALNYMSKALAIAKTHYKEHLHFAMSFQVTTAEKWPRLSAKTNVDYWHKALAIAIKLFGENHYQVARYYYLLGQALECNGEVNTALLQYETAFKILSKQTIIHSNLVKSHNEHIKLMQVKLLKYNS